MTYEMDGTGIEIPDRALAQELLTGETRVLTAIARGEPLPVVLGELCRLVERLSACSVSTILLYDPKNERLWLGAGPSLPAGFDLYAGGVKIGPRQGACGAAVYHRGQVITPDIATDPIWADYKDEPLAHGLLACWSSPILAADGSILGTFAIFARRVGAPTNEDHALIRQITHVASIAIERSRAEEKIRRTEVEFRAIVDAIPHPISVITSTGDVLYCNQPVLELFGLTTDEVAAGELIERMHPGDRAASRERINLAITKPEAFEAEYRMRMADGGFRWFLNHFKPVLDEQGTILRWYVSGVDIEDRKRQEERMRKENIALREELDARSMFDEIVGVSPPLRTVLARVDQVAPADSTVLILGETGTGKELIARAVHKRSRRAGGAFVTVNCAAFPPALVASELFGHEKGAFTGAQQRRLGRFELAEGGTLFLDEVGELPIETQATLLRVLQEREFERVGGNEAIRIDVRVIAATNRDLQGLIVDGKFRSDLFYRLNVFPIELPRLRDRAGDIPRLVEHFVRRFAKRAGKHFGRIDPATLARLVAYPWPGNIRELQNVIERSVILCESDDFAVDESWLSETPAQEGRFDPPPLAQHVAEHEKALIERALADSRGRVSGPYGAAARLGMPASTLDSKIKTLKINKHQFKTV